MKMSFSINDEVKFRFTSNFVKEITDFAVLVSIFVWTYTFLSKPHRKYIKSLISFGIRQHFFTRIVHWYLIHLILSLTVHLIWVFSIRNSEHLDWGICWTKETTLFEWSVSNNSFVFAIVARCNLFCVVCCRFNRIRQSQLCMCTLNHISNYNWHSFVHKIGGKLASFLLWNLCSLGIYLVWMLEVVESTLFQDICGFSADEVSITFYPLRLLFITHTQTHTYMCIDPAARMELYAHKHIDTYK